MDAYGDGTIWASIEDGQGHGTQVCIDGRRGSPTCHRLFEQARHPRQRTAVLVELGAPEEGIVVPLMSHWLDSSGPRALGFRDEGKEIIQAALLRLGEQPGPWGTTLLEIVVPRPLDTSQRQGIERCLAAALETTHLGQVTGGGFGGGITDFFVGVKELAAGLAVIRGVLREQQSAVCAVIKQYYPIQVVHGISDQ